MSRIQHSLFSSLDISLNWAPYVCYSHAELDRLLWRGRERLRKKKERKRERER